MSYDINLIGFKRNHNIIDLEAMVGGTPYLFWMNIADFINNIHQGELVVPFIDGHKINIMKNTDDDGEDYLTAPIVKPDGTFHSIGECIEEVAKIVITHRIIQGSGELEIYVSKQFNDGSFKTNMVKVELSELAAQCVVDRKLDHYTKMLVSQKHKDSCITIALHEMAHMIDSVSGNIEFVPNRLDYILYKFNLGDFDPTPNPTKETKMHDGIVKFNGVFIRKDFVGIDVSIYGSDKLYLMNLNHIKPSKDPVVFPVKIQDIRLDFTIEPHDMLTTSHINVKAFVDALEIPVNSQYKYQIDTRESSGQYMVNLIENAEFLDLNTGKMVTYYGLVTTSECIEQKYLKKYKSKEVVVEKDYKLKAESSTNPTGEQKMNKDSTQDKYHDGGSFADDENFHEEPIEPDTSPNGDLASLEAKVDELTELVKHQHRVITHMGNTMSILHSDLMRHMSHHHPATPYYPNFVPPEFGQHMPQPPLSPNGFGTTPPTHSFNPQQPPVGYYPPSGMGQGLYPNPVPQQPDQPNNTSNSVLGQMNGLNQRLKAQQQPTATKEEIKDQAVFWSNFLK